MGQTLPSGTVTFLFTDIQGSTELWDAFPHEMREALVAHDEIIGVAVDESGGAVVKSTGDGVFAAFPSAAAAADAAVLAQRRLVEFEWDPVIDTIAVRMALHTDQAEAKGGDYHGSAVNRTARIEAAGHGGQILVSDATAQALAGSLPAGTELSDLGTHSLRGLSRPEVIHQLNSPGLRTSFPPLRTTSVAAGILPEFATSFVGRSSDIEAIVSQLAAPDCRVLTVLGPGGIGKTRLAVEAARRIGDTAGAVAHFVPLVSVPTPDAIVGEIAESLNFTVDLHLSSMIDEVTQVIDLLRKQRMILVLDNFEHLVGGAALVTRIVESAPEVDIIVTSRERLAIGSEWVYDLGGMDTSDRGRSDAVALFVERAQKAGGVLTQDSTEEVAVLCHTLGGMPLAIELAAAWTPMISVAEITAEVQDSLDILAGSLSDVPERHRSVKAAFDHSWSRLERPLQESFARLAVFPAPFTREAAAAVADTRLPTLHALMSKSLVRRAELDTFDVHPLLRELGLEALGDQREEMAGRHAAYYVSRLLERSDDLIGGADQIGVKDELVTELGNLRPATVWAVHHLPTGEAVRVITTLNEFYFLASWGQGVDHLGALADEVEAALGPEGALNDDRYLWAKTLALVFLSQFGNVDEVVTQSERLVPAWELRDGTGLAWSLTALGVALDEAGQLDRARAALDRALDEGLGDDGLLKIQHRAWHGWVIIEQGDIEHAQEIWRQGLAEAEEINHNSGRAYLLSKLGVAADQLGNHEEAARLHTESREFFVKAGDLGGEGYTLSRLSWTHNSMGEYAKARQYGQEGLARFDDINHRWGVATSWCRIGLAEVGLGDADAARTSFLTGMQLALDNGMQVVAYYALLGMGRVLAMEGRREDAVRLLAHNVNAAQNPYAELARVALDELADVGGDELRTSGAGMRNEEAIALARSE
ncbi:MAG: tetratricopeptide repeat protein [Acidimicrobiia bacterium]|nr:tetratricopeptide repeat protein [Acidimicrobiia bacterium]NNF89340.1 tetratricopeptide repeat protein [Acidimicrobiia bacterium]NNL98919.1 tetratricopeptide repeat protein [Acidimicrobiia bacterium]